MRVGKSGIVMTQKLISNWKEALPLIEKHTEDYVLPEYVVEPLLSVLLTTYQQRAYIAEALESILRQKTSFPYEVLIGEDGSTDGTFEYLREMQARHPDKIRILRSNPNLGKYTGSGMLNLLRTMRAAKGKYIALLEGDDYWTDDTKLQRQVDLLEQRDDASGSWHDVEIIGNRVVSDMYLDMSKASDFSFEDQLGGKCACATGSLVLRKSLLPDQWEDWQITAPWFDQFVIAHYSLHGLLVKVEGKLGVYRTHVGGVTQSAFWGGWDMARRLVDYAHGMRIWCGPRGDQYYAEMEQRYFEFLFVRGLRKPDIESLKAIYSGAKVIGLGSALNIGARKIWSRLFPSPSGNSQDIR